MSYNLDDVSLVPRIVSTIESRNDVEIKVKLNNRVFTTPIVASPMKDVCDGNVASIMVANGGMAIIHRFNTIEEQVANFLINKSFSSNSAIPEPNSPWALRVACAIGVEGDSFERYQALRKVGCSLFCIDTANGANIKVKKMLEKVDDNCIAGNVASQECFAWLQNFSNVVGIRVGIAGGSGCTTKNATGIFNGMATCIKECAAVKRKALLIADGGIKEPGDYCKAIALGADMVMLGSEIAATKDSPAELYQTDNKTYKLYHGSASHEIQKNYRETPRYIEGRTRLLEFKNESLESLLVRYNDGLRSSMSYFDAMTLDYYRMNARFVYKN